MASRRLPRRRQGYAPIEDYAAIGDGRTVALVARDGSIDWLCLPNLDSPSVFAALLDAQRGGAFRLAPDEPYAVERRYVPGTNVLESTFFARGGVVRVTDAMTLPRDTLPPLREVARRIEGLAGRVPLAWRVEPRLGYGEWPTRVERRDWIPVACARADAVALCSWGSGEPACGSDAIEGRFECREGARALLVLCAAHSQPLVFSNRDQVEARLDATIEFWRRWSDERTYRGPWREAVCRSALALKLLVYAPSGAIAASPTTSLPERIGGERNWDYRYCWLRDSAFTLDALLQLGCLAETHSFFWWFMHATQLTQPWLRVLYRLDGGAHAPERSLALAGYRDSRPVRVGNGASAQLQLDVYGDLFDTAWRYTASGGAIDRDTGRELAAIADLVCDIWRRPDQSIWEVRMEPLHFTHSKAMCWVALERAARLAEAGRLPARRLSRWRAEAEAIRAFIEARCWSARNQSYVRAADQEELDASLLLVALMRYHDPREPRMLATIEAVRRELGHGPLLYRYSGRDGLSSGEGAFLCCSFWLVQALAMAGRLDEAAYQMEALLGFANDVGLYAEEVDPATREFLGNFPQGLVHLSLIGAALAIGERWGR